MVQTSNGGLQIATTNEIETHNTHSDANTHGFFSTDANAVEYHNLRIRIDPQSQALTIETMPDTSALVAPVEQSETTTSNTEYGGNADSAAEVHAIRIGESDVICLDTVGGEVQIQVLDNVFHVRHENGVVQNNQCNDASNDGVSVGTKPKKRSKKRTSVSESEQYACGECDEVKHSLAALKRHQLSYHRPLPYECPK